MRKFLVVLLVLSVLGGAFAQEGTWGDISGAIELNTTMNFVPDDPTIGGGIHSNEGMKAVIEYQRDFGPFSMTLPLRIDASRMNSDGTPGLRWFGTDWNDEWDGGRRTRYDKTKANFAYENGNLSVVLPFWLQFNDSTIGGGTVGIIPIGVGDMAARITYEEDNFGFKFNIDNLLGGSGETMAIGAVGGYYHFMDGQSQLYVSHNWAYGTQWWRASEYMLNEIPGRYHAGSDDDENFSRWEDISRSGIAYRFFVMPELNIGISFASSQPLDLTLFGPADELKDFFLSPIFGAKFDNETLAISAMLGLEPYGDNKSDVYIAAGFAYNLSESIKVNADLSVVAFAADNTDPDFNVGLEVSYGADDIVAGIGFKGLDLANDMIFFGTDFIVGYNIGRDSSYGEGYWKNYRFHNAWSSPHHRNRGNDGFFAGLSGNFLMGNNSDAKVMGTQMGMQFLIGYKNYELTDSIKVSIVGTLNLDTRYSAYDGTQIDSQSGSRFGFYLAPTIEWSVFSNGSIVFEYDLGAENLSLDDPLNKHSITARFKWSF